MTPDDLARLDVDLAPRGRHRAKDPALLAVARRLLAEVHRLRAELRRLEGR